MPSSSTLRLLLSQIAWTRLEPAIREALGTRPFEVLIASAHADQAPGDADLAFISRDVTGLSTKHTIQETLQAFYESLRRSPRLQWVHTHSAGADRPIFAELLTRGVTVTTSSGANAEVVAQTAIAGLLALARCFPRLWQAQRQREWASLMAHALPADLAGQTAVVAGWGPIGQQITALLQALRLKVIVARRRGDEGGERVETIAFEEIPQAAPRADWLILACPLSERTRAMVDARLFNALKPGARLINVARGEIVVQDDLVAALRDGRLAGAYLDVFEFEPLGKESALWDMDNVIITPHSAGHSDGNEARVDQMFLQHLRRLA